MGRSHTHTHTYTHVLTGWVASGTCVTLHVEGVPAEYFASIPDGLAFVVFGLLEHENRKSVLNFKLQMHPT